MADEEKKLDEATEVTDTEVKEDVAEEAVTEESAEETVKDESAPVPAKETKPAKKEKKEEKKPGFFSRMGTSIKKFCKTLKSELKKVTWYSRKQTFTSTLLVLVVMAVSAVLIGLLDVGFSMGIEGLANLF